MSDHELVLLNSGFIELDRLEISNDLNVSIENNANSQNPVNINVYDDSSKSKKFNSFPMRIKKPAGTKLKSEPKSSSTINYKNTEEYTVLSEEELTQIVKLSCTRMQENVKLKQLLRNNYWSFKHPIRNYLWKCLLKQTASHSKSNITSNLSDKENNVKNEIYCNESDYNKHLNHIFGKLRDIEVGLPEFAIASPKLNTDTTSHQSNNNHLNYYYLNNKGKQAVKRILCVYEYHYPQVTFSPGLVSISSILLHYMHEHEVFAALCFMSSSKDHLIESKSSWETTCSVFTRLLKNYCKASYEIIAKYATDPLETIFSEWYWWIFDCLSFEYLVKIMDCFLFEGQKVLYRVSLAIVQLFSRYIEILSTFENEAILTEYIYLDVVKTESIKVNKDSIKQFCESTANLQSIDKLLKVSFSIRNLKRSTIKDFFLKEEIKKKLNNSTTNKKPPLISTSNEGMTIPDSQGQSSPNHIYLNETSTSALSHANLSALWSWIPQRLTVYSPEMLYTSQEHGTSINTLFNIIDEMEYSIIIVKTFENEIFGAFCSGLWSDRKQKVNYFGNGETFLFTLAPEKKVFKWVGTKTKTMPNQEMFLRSDGNKIAIGGGTKDGLAIKSNLIEGATYKCDTFENDPLCSSNNFNIAILEVIGFK